MKPKVLVILLSRRYHQVEVWGVWPLQPLFRETASRFRGKGGEWKRNSSSEGPQVGLQTLDTTVRWRTSLSAPHYLLLWRNFFTLSLTLKDNVLIWIWLGSNNEKWCKQLLRRLKHCRLCMSWTEGQTVGLGSWKPSRQTGKMSAGSEEADQWFPFWTLCSHCCTQNVHLQVCASIKGFMLQSYECCVSCVALKSADYICTDRKHLVCERARIL